YPLPAKLALQSSAARELLRDSVGLPPDKRIAQMLMTWLYPIAILICTMQSGAPAPSGDGRILKRFDFAEQKRGTFESFPSGWRPIYGPGYPRFLEARFDLDSGHEAAPCFKFPLGGGSVGASYQFPDIPANPACEYRVTGWIRTENLIHGSAR